MPWRWPVACRRQRADGAPRIPSPFQLCKRWQAAGTPPFEILFVLTVLIRLLNLDTALPGGVAQVPPLDDLYHAKRMSFSALSLDDLGEHVSSLQGEWSVHQP